MVSIPKPDFHHGLLDIWRVTYIWIVTYVAYVTYV